MNPRLRALLLGIAVAAGLLILLEVAGELQGGAVETGSGTLVRLSLVVRVLVGGLVAVGIWLGRHRDAVVPLTAGILLLWPALPVLIPAVPAPPDWMPLLGSVGGSGVVLVLVGALLGGGALSAR